MLKLSRLEGPLGVVSQLGMLLRRFFKKVCGLSVRLAGSTGSRAVREPKLWGVRHEEDFEEDCYAAVPSR